MVLAHFLFALPYVVVVLAARIALVINGRVQQVAAPEDVFTRPANSAVARFMGVHNLVLGEVQAD